MTEPSQLNPSRRGIVASVGILTGAGLLAASKPASADDDGDLRRELRLARDIQQITVQLHRYCRALDRLDEALLRSVFHPHSTHDMGGFVGNSTDFCTFAIDLLKHLERTQHLLGNVMINPDGDKAVSESYFVAYHRLSGERDAKKYFPDHQDGKDEDLFIAGRYLDRFERRDGAWRIIHRTGVQDWARWEPAEARGQISRGKRDADDPLYGFFRRG